jgi:hypothetical protein
VKETPARGDFEDFRGVIEQREYFQLAVTPPQQKDPALQAAQPPASLAVAGEMVKYYRLVGIIMDRDPQAVVEDLRNRTTHFLSRGDMMPREDAGKAAPQVPWGNMTVEDILPGRVTFNIDGQIVGMDL